MPQRASSNINDHLKRDVSALAKLLESLPNGFDPELRKDILQESAKPLVAAAASLAPRSKKTHYMYNTGKLTKRLRSPKGMGNVTGIFHPGNLGRSVQVLKHGPFRKSNAVYVGPRYPRRMSLRSRITVAPYAHMVEFGTSRQSAQPFLRPAFDKTQRIVFSLARSKFGKHVDKWVNKNKR